MAYADQEVSGNRIAAFVIVALIHVVVGYALVTGLAYEGVKAVMDLQAIPPEDRPRLFADVQVLEQAQLHVTHQRLAADRAKTATTPRPRR